MSTCYPNLIFEYLYSNNSRISNRLAVPGMLFGAVRGIVKTGSPKVSALFSGLTWFILGSHYTGQCEGTGRCNSRNT